jgi:hypothetical protein
MLESLLIWHRPRLRQNRVAALSYFVARFADASSLQMRDFQHMALLLFFFWSHLSQPTALNL